MSDFAPDDERRRAQRLSIMLPIEVGEGRGITRDVSGLGVYFVTDRPFEVETELDFRLHVPDALTVRCKGRIVRIVPERDGYGVAVTVDEYVVDDQPAASTRAHIVIEELRKHHG